MKIFSDLKSSSKNEYEREASRIKEAAHLLNPFETIDRLERFSFFSANLTNFIPTLPYAQHSLLFRKAYAYQRLSLLDEQYFDREVPLEVEGWSGPLADRVGERPHVICTLHAGSYRYVSYLLTVSRIPFAVLISGQAMAQAAGFRKRYADWHRRHGLSGELPIIAADDPRAIWQMLKLLKAGYQLLVYLDGFTGLETNEDQLQAVPFMGQHLKVRRGASFLAQRLKLPLLPMLCMRDGNTIRVVADDPICGYDDSQFSALAMTRMFSFFASHLLFDPAQGENWFFLHQQIETAALHSCREQAVAIPKQHAGSLPTPDQYGMYRHAERCFLLKKAGCQSYEMKSDYFDMLWTQWALNT